MDKITEKQYFEAIGIVERYQHQNEPKMKEVSVRYNAIIDAYVRVPFEMEVSEIMDKLKDGYQHLNGMCDIDDVKFLSITELIVNGEVIKLN